MPTNHASSRGQLYIGGALVGLGLLFLLGTLFQINVGALCWPIALIALGVLLVMRPRMSASGTGVTTHLLGDLKRRGAWTVANEEIWLGVADVDLDLTSAVIPAGETVIHIYSFVGDMDIWLPASAGVAVVASGVFMDTEILGRDFEGFLTPVEYSSEGYAAAERRVRIEVIGVVVDLKVRTI